MQRVSVLLLVILFLGFLSGSNPAAPVPAKTYYGVFQELPITDITPEGWLAQILERQRDGLATHGKASGYPFDTSLWVGKLPKVAWAPYEQTAYFVDGIYRCGLLLKDKPLTDLGLASIRYTLDHPQADGKLGPTPQELGGKMGPDGVEGPRGVGYQWPFAVFSRALMAHYEATHDKTVLDELTKHYLAWGKDLTFGSAARDLMNIEAICWLYEQTGDVRLRDLAERIWATALQSKVVNPKQEYNLDNLAKGPRMFGHGVTVSEQTKQPVLLYLATGKKEYLDAAVGAFSALHRDHELIDGGLTSDAVLSGKEPHHSHETCVIIDYPWSLGYLLMATGDGQWADTIERATLNAGFGVIGKDFHSLQYYDTPNQAFATQESSEPTNKNTGRPWQAYRPDHAPACCTGNVERLMPNYAARLWMSDGQGGLAATLYAPNTLRAPAGADRVPVTIQEKTGYPFDGVIELKITAEKPVAFPLYVRIPGWAEGTHISVNGTPVDEKPKPGTFLKIDRTFASGDTVKLNLPMNVRTEEPVANGLSIFRGPLLYALKIKADATQVTNPIPSNEIEKADPNFPSWDIKPASAWNYSLALGDSPDLSKIKVQAQPVKDFPWTPESTPVVLTVPARKVPAWVPHSEGKTPPLPKPPLLLSAETEQVELIPLGATQIRISVFPEAKAAVPVK